MERPTVDQIKIYSKEKGVVTFKGGIDVRVLP